MLVHITLTNTTNIIVYYGHHNDCVCSFWISTSSPVVNVVQDYPRKKNIISDNSNNSNINDLSLGHHITTTSHALFDTTGDILDPTSQVTSGKRIAIDPMKYLRTFSYGRVSTNSAGDTSTTIREFT